MKRHDLDRARMSTDRRVQARDRGVRRVSVLTRWTIGGGLALSGGFSVLAERQFTQHLQQVAAANAAGTQVVASGVSPASTGAVAPPVTSVPATVAPLTPPSTAPRSAARRSVTTTRPSVSKIPAVRVPSTVRLPITPETVPVQRQVVVSGGS